MSFDLLHSVSVGLVFWGVPPALFAGNFVLCGRVVFNLRLTARLGSMAKRVSGGGRGGAAGKDILEEHTKGR